MKFVKTLLSGLFCLAVASCAYGDQGCLQITYAQRGVNAPLGCPCENTTAHPYADGVPICVFWDNNANGPDVADVQPVEGEGYAQVNFTCLAMNGAAQGYGQGFFDTDPYFCVNGLPVAPDTALYYLQINIGGCCWRSDVFAVPPVIHDWFLDEVNWHCVNSPCSSGGQVPSAPVNCVASDDLYCLSVLVTWQHDGQNVSGFNIYADGAFVTSAGSTERSSEFAVFTDRLRSYRVTAYNAAGESAPSNADDGSTYQLRFAPGLSGNLTGNNRHGQQFTIQFERPTAQCYTGAQLWLLVNNQRHSLLCSGSWVTSLTCTLPDDTTLNNCRLLLVDSSMIYPQVVLTDTTDSTFHLGIPSSTDDPLPVELLSFTAVPGDAQVLLHWQTASETGSDCFEIERNGVLVHHTPAVGDATGHSYAWTDRDLTNGQSYHYALWSVEVNGERSLLSETDVTPRAGIVSVTEYALHANYPNPFNPTTDIAFDLPEEAKVSLKVFDVTGREVAVLVNGEKAAGRHRVKFDARDLPTGMYFCRMTAKDFTASQKMMLIR